MVDALRALAMLSVFGLHLGVAAGGLEAAWYRPLVARLDIGVTLFFLLSGFLLYRPFVAARAAGGPARNLRRYARGRVLRILPAYWLALTVLALYPGLPQMWGDHPWAYYLLLQQYVDEWLAGGLLQTWSLGVEAAFYILLPIVALGISRVVAPGRAGLRREALLLAALAVAAVAFRGLLGSGPEGFAGLPDVTPSNPEITPGESRFVLLPGTVFTGLPGSFDWFVLGMLLAVASVALEGRERQPPVARLIARRPELCWGAAAAIAIAAAATGVLPTFPQVLGRGQWLAATVTYGVISLLALAPAVLSAASGPVGAVMSAAPLRWLGVVSYGCFLWHVPILGKLSESDIWGSYRVIGIGLTGFAITLAAATLSYYGLERPLLRLKDR